VSDLVAVIIPAGGSGERLGAKIPKALVQLAGKTLIEHAVANMAPIANQIIVAVPAGYEEQFQNLLGSEVTVITGGLTRTLSVKSALTHVTKENDYILVHDAARALATTDLAMRIIDSLRAGEKAVIPGLEVTDTIKRIDVDNYVTKTPTRSKLRAIQTPQGFTRKLLMKAHSSPDDVTDDASLVEDRGVDVKVILGESRALKITTMDDLAIAQNMLIAPPDNQLRVGIGTDTHAFASDQNRAMWLAGLFWPNEIGVDGHSDGDVAAHAICDALFSAASLGDLGSNFGTSDPKYAGASGVQLLKECAERVGNAGYLINNVAVQIIGNHPKIANRRAEAIYVLSQALGGAPVSVSATTTDGLGFTGEGQGISAIATALLIPNLLLPSPR
jgi:2-C-methyl-D-erythritol 4-phosphate cytidylyltransferase/2-C-methyl-D-erythritol 2,4-cyclodiphosphate synthase